MSTELGAPDRLAVMEHIRMRFGSLRCAEVEKLIGIMANPIRFHILCALVTRPFTVSELVEITGATLSNVSQQLKQMWIGGYLSKERHSKQILYRIADTRIPRLIAFLEDLFPEDALGGCE